MDFRASQASPADKTTATRRRISRYMVVQYLLDLAVSVSIVLLGGWLFQEAVGDGYLREAGFTQNSVYVAISRFAPPSLFYSYFTTISDLGQGLSYQLDFGNGMPALGQVFTATGETVLQLALAAPYTLAVLYQQTSGIAALFVLMGFAVTIATVLGWLIKTGFAPWRLLLASILSPIAVSLVFAVLKAFLVLILNASLTLTALAPYAAACPLICTPIGAFMPTAVTYTGAHR